MRKRTKLIGILMLAVVMIMASMSLVYADETQTLDQAIEESSNNSSNSNNQSEDINSAASSTSSSVDEEDSDVSSMVDLYKGTTDLSEQAGAVSGLAEKGQKLGSIIFNVIGIVIAVGLGVMIALDILFIAFKPLRGLLGGKDPANTPGAQAGMNGGMGMGGMGMGGMGGYSGGMYGGSRYGGGMYGGMNGMGMGGMGMNGMGGQAGMQGCGMSLSRTGIVSDAAIMAVNLSQTPDADGSVKSAWGLYATHMVINLVIPPILLILAGSGVLTNVGFAVGEMAVNLISGFSFN